VFSQGWGGELCLPVQGEVDRGEAFRKMPGRVLGPKGREGGKDGGSLAEAGFAYGGAQATLRAASRLRYLQ